MTERPDAVDVALGEGGAEGEARVRSDPGFAREVEALRPVVARLEAMGPEPWRPEAPPPLRHPATPRRPRVRRRLVVVATTAVAAVLAAIIAVRADDGRRTVALAALPAAALPDAQGEAQLTDDAVRLEVALAPSRAGEYYELWTVDGDRVISLGTFRVGEDGEASARFTLGVPARGALDVSVEPLDGDPAHSSRSVLRSDPL